MKGDHNYVEVKFHPPVTLDTLQVLKGQVWPAVTKLDRARVHHHSECYQIVLVLSVSKMAKTHLYSKLPLKIL